MSYYRHADFIVQEPFSFPKSISAHIWWLGARRHISGSVITQVCSNTQKLKVCLHSNGHPSQRSAQHTKFDKDFHGTWMRCKKQQQSRYLEAGSGPRAALICRGSGPSLHQTEPGSVSPALQRGQMTRFHLSSQLISRTGSIFVCYPGHWVNCGVG